MSGRPHTLAPEDLLQHAGWMRRLAGRLVHDAQAAEDLSQETWVRALEHPPRADRPVRGWLATVMRNLAAQRRRGDHRRRGRELGAAREEALASALELFEKVATQRQLVDAVMELEEPYRSTILLRYFEDYAPKRMAAELDVPLSTVKSRLARGLERLRARLDEHSGGDGRTWVLALLPLARHPAGAAGGLLSTSTLAAGAAVVNVKLVLSVLALLALGVTTWVVGSDRGTAPPPEPEQAARSSRPVERELARQEPEAPAPTAVTESDRAVVAAAAPVEPVDAAPVPPDPSVCRGRVIDVDSRPVAGVRVGLSRASASGGVELSSPDLDPAGVTDSSGRFELEGAGAGYAGLLLVDEERFVTVLGGESRGDGHDAVVVVAPRLVLSGVVVDEAGLPLEGAALRVALPTGFRGRFDAILDDGRELPVAARSDAQGRFEMLSVPAIQGARLSVGLSGYVASEQDAPTASDERMVLVLRRPRLQGDVLQGIVVNALGSPVEGARVSHGFDTVVTDEQGRFRFDLGREDVYNNLVRRWMPDFTADELQAVRAGFLPASFRAPVGEDGAPEWPDRVVLRLGGEALSISGRVVDAEGEPLEGLRVWVGDPTFFGALGDPAASERPRSTHLESEMAGLQPGWNTVSTDAEGRFRIDGLLDRAYSLEAMDPATLLRVVRPDVPAGRTNVELVVPSDGTFEVLRGRIVDRRGEPVEGVHVFPMCDAFRTRVGGRVISTQHETTESVVTDPDGRFEVRDVPRHLAYLRIDGSETIPLEWGRGVEGGLEHMVGEDFEDLEITVGRRCHFQVELADASEADTLAVLDAAGVEQTISEYHGNGRRDGPRHPLVEGRTGSLAVTDAATTLVLYRDDVEVRRAPLELVPGEKPVIRP